VEEQRKERRRGRIRRKEKERKKEKERAGLKPGTTKTKEGAAVLRPYTRRGEEAEEKRENEA
jgi:hypothetical protein